MIAQSSSSDDYSPTGDGHSRYKKRYRLDKIILEHLELFKYNQAEQLKILNNNYN